MCSLMLIRVMLFKTSFLRTDSICLLSPIVYSVVILQSISLNAELKSGQPEPFIDTRYDTIPSDIRKGITCR